MLFDSSLRRELWRGFVGTLVVLITVVLTMMLIRLLGLAAKGSVAVADVSLMLGYTMIGQMPTLISLALFVAVVGMLNRLYRDTEMLVWQASGVRLLRLLKPLWQMSWPVLVMLALLVLVARPWAQQQTELLKARFEKRSDIARVAPGQFQTSADGRRVFFIDSHSDGERTGKNVFIVLTEGDVEAVVNAREGRIETSQGLRYLQLWHGERVETRLSTGEKTRSRFESARILIGDAPTDGPAALMARSMPTLALFHASARDQKAELVWRLGTVWSGLNLVLIALATSSSQIRRANAWSMVWALLAFIVYYNLLTLSQAWVATGKLTDGAGLFGIHGAVMLAALTALWWRDGSWRRASNEPVASGARA
ncbi:MAG TPA: LPS export ABC transporter permease LptF [Aquabacterium sp.]|uniref:LPS export ABC transporter permease LptF n=1 Tax=Aquabacterium sp. TaxID=1872578 RepID=UPI002E3695FD|nr:LPS export ABC transporter permease LptF [Aquabacterium sp.]HEX5373189.1 LPS export ABC transporter permease LptF [Aquabacterium sp.]